MGVVLTVSKSRARWTWCIGVLMASCIGLSPSGSWAIDLDISLEQANEALAAGRQTMEKAESVEDVANIMKASEQAIRVGANPEENPCGPHAILRTRRYWLEYFGRREAAESKRQKQDVRMPEAKIQEILNMPYLEVEIRLCGEEEFFAEGAEVALQQGRENIRPVDIGPAERGRKTPAIPQHLDPDLRLDLPMPILIQNPMVRSPYFFQMGNSLTFLRTFQKFGR